MIYNMSKSRFDYSWPRVPENKKPEDKVVKPATWWTIGWTVDEVNKSLEKERNKGKLIPPSKK